MLAQPAHPGSGSVPVGPTVSARENTKISALLTLVATGPGVLATQIHLQGRKCSGEEKNTSPVLLSYELERAYFPFMKLGNFDHYLDTG